MQISPQFIRSIKASLTYWSQEIEQSGSDPFVLFNRRHDNIHQAVTAATVPLQTTESAATLIVQLFDIIEQGAYWRAWPDLLQKVSQRDIDPQLKCQILSRLGRLLCLARDTPQAIKVSHLAASLAEEIGDSQLNVEAHISLAQSYYVDAQYDKASEAAKHAHKLCDQFDTNSNLKAYVWNTLGIIEGAQGRWDVAISHAHKAIELAALYETPAKQARMINNLARALTKAQKYDEALVCFQQALDLLDATSSQIDRVSVQLSFGTLYAYLSRWEEAYKQFEAIDSNYLQHSGNFYLQALKLNNIGNVLTAQHKFEQARVFLREGETLWRQLDYSKMLANTLIGIGDLDIKLGDVDRAKTVYEEALELLLDCPEDAETLSWIEKAKGKIAEI